MQSYTEKAQEMFMAYKLEKKTQSNKYRQLWMTWKLLVIWD